MECLGLAAWLSGYVFTHAERLRIRFPARLWEFYLLEYYCKGMYRRHFCALCSCFILYCIRKMPLHSADHKPEEALRLFTFLYMWSTEKVLHSRVLTCKSIVTVVVKWKKRKEGISCL